jgi:hypothetical protein
MTARQRWHQDGAIVLIILAIPSCNDEDGASCCVHSDVVVVRRPRETRPVGHHANTVAYITSPGFHIRPSRLRQHLNPIANFADSSMRPRASVLSIGESSLTPRLHCFAALVLPARPDDQWPEIRHASLHYVTCERPRLLGYAPCR